MYQQNKFEQGLEWWSWLSNLKKYLIAWPIAIAVGLGWIQLRNIIYTTEEDRKVDACIAQSKDSRDKAIACLAEGFNKYCLSDYESLSERFDLFWKHRYWYRWAASDLAQEDEEMNWSCPQYDKRRYSGIPLSTTQWPWNNIDFPLEIDAETLQQNWPEYSNISTPEIVVEMLAAKFMSVCKSREYDTEWLKNEYVEHRDRVFSENPDIFPYENFYYDSSIYDQVHHFIPRYKISRWICSQYANNSHTSWPYTGEIEIHHNEFAYEVYQEALERFFPGWHPWDDLLVWNKALELLRWKYQSSIEKWEWEIDNKTSWTINAAWEYIVTKYFIKK